MKDNSIVWEKRQKKKTFSVPVKNELHNGKTITYIIKFIGSFRFILSSSSSHVDNLSEGLIYNYKCTSCKSCLDCISTKDNQLIFKCTECSKNHKKYFNKDLIKRFENTYEFYGKDINKFTLLRKGVYPYEYIAEKDLMKNYFLTNNLFTVVQTCKTLQMLIVNMQEMYSKSLKLDSHLPRKCALFASLKAL